jgi:hypothetical protein
VPAVPLADVALAMPIGRLSQITVLRSGLDPYVTQLEKLRNRATGSKPGCDAM